MANENKYENSEILYRVDKRNPFDMIFRQGSIILFFSTFSLFFVFAGLGLTSLIGFLFLLISAFMFFNLIAFNEIIIYKYKVVLDRKFIGISVIKIEDIQKIENVGGRGSDAINIVTKQSWFSRFKYITTSLYDEDSMAIKQIIKNLTKDKK